jgi:hypothetical protein
MPDMMTLPEYAKGLDKNSVSRPFVESFALSSDIYQMLPFDGMTGAVYEYHREAAMPDSMAFRAINEAGTNGNGVLEPFQESAYIVDHDIDVDSAIVRRYGPERRAREQRLGMAGLGRLWAQTFINGDNSTNPREFNGLKKRCAMQSTDRVVNNSASSGGGALSLLKLDETIERVNGANALIAPRTFRPLFTAAARTPAVSGNIFQTWDEIGKPKMTYGGIPVLFGYEREIEGDLLAFDEVASGGGSAVTASIYAVRFGEGGLFGVQLAPMEAIDKGLLEDHITMRTHISWDVGLVDQHAYCVARLTSISNAAIVA